MHNASTPTHPSIGDHLLKAGILEETALVRAKTLASSTGLDLETAILRLGLAEEATVLKALATVMSLPFVDEIARLGLDADIVAQLGLPYLRRYTLAPVGTDDGCITILTATPGNQQLVKELAFQLESDIQLIVAPARAIHKTLDRLATKNTSGPSEEQTALDKKAFDAAQLDGPVIAFVSQKLNEAVAQGASDLHFASSNAGLGLRFRINGVLIRQDTIASINPSAVFARLKVMSGMNVAERRKPQDGRITSVIAGRVVDFRVSSMPTQLGESVVVRVLDPKALRLGWEHLGFDPETESAIREIVEMPSGLFLVTGPTGSGKTTTLYTALNHLRSERRKIITIEDPVEYQLPDVDQVQVQNELGLGFADALRSVLRQDPNVIMVGEIRDAETAEIACRAALVGRMVLSTLHTNSARGALPRMLDLGVEEFILRDVLRGVLGQSLETVHCGSCQGAGCSACDMTGTSGRHLRAELVRF